MKYLKSKCQNIISEAHLHDIIRIAALSTEPNIATTMQQKKQFHKSHGKHVAKQKNSNI